MIKFYIALWASKLCTFLYTLMGNRQDDKPGMLALKICDDFIDKINKPTIICITGTNGKTTVTNMVSNMLLNDKKKVIYNDWGANTRSGVSRCLLDGVTIFNRSKKDYAILETDELLSNEILPSVKPKYLVVTNLSRDSLHRNAHPYYIFDKINNFIPKETTLILNADDPISSELGNDNKCLYFGISEQKTDSKVPINIINDFRICPNCNTKVIYNYIRYHHIGNYYCPNCHKKSKEADYLITKIDYDKQNIKVKFKDKEDEYPIINDSIFNIYNLLAATTLMRELDYKPKEITNLLNSNKIVASRYSNTIVKGIEINTIASKGLQGMAPSRVMDYIKQETGNIEVILVLDDATDKKYGSECTTWIYEIDFEFLNKDNIKRIIVGGVRSNDYKARLLLAGIDREKIVCTQDEEDTYKYLLLKNTDKVFICHDLFFVSGAKKIKDKIIEKINNN